MTFLLNWTQLHTLRKRGYTPFCANYSIADRMGVFWNRIAAYPFGYVYGN